jgi:hypothetical protein
MLSRRGFLGALTAIVAMPKALVTTPPVTPPRTFYRGARPDGTYYYRVMYVDATGGETLAAPTTSLARPSK